MKREFSPLYLASFLLFGCILLRVLNSVYPNAIPNISPLMPLAFVGAIYLPRKWGWLLGPVAYLLTSAAMLEVNRRTDGSGIFFGWPTVMAWIYYTAIFMAAAALGLWIARRKSLAKILAGSVVCSVVFYVAANTYSWVYDAVVRISPGYPTTLAGWWQANSIGLPGYAPSWTFLRNGVAGDLFFTCVVLLVFDRALLVRPFAAKAAPRMA